MALNLGTLTGYLELDGSPFDRGLDEAAGKLKDFGGKGAKIAATAGLAVASAFAASMVANIGIDAANDKLAAQLGLNEAESARVGQVAGELYAGAWGDSMEQVNTAVGAVMSSIEGMADASSSDLQAVTATALDLATTFDLDVQRAVASVGTLMKSGLAPDAEQAFDLIVAASQRVPAHLREDILDASDEYSQFFASLGFDGQEAFGMLVKGAEKGMYGIDKTGDAIKEFTIRATDGSKSTATAFESMGLNFRSVESDLLAGGPKASAAFQQVVDSLLSVEDPAARAQTAIALFGTPLEDLNATEIPQFLRQLQGGGKAMKDFEGSADQMSATLNDNAKTSFTSMKRQAQLLFMSLANDALPVIDDVSAAMASGMGPAFSAAKDEVQKLGPAVQAVTDFLAEHDDIANILAFTIGTIIVGALAAWALQSTITATKVVLSWVATQLAAAGSLTVQALAFALVVAGWLLMGTQALIGAARIAASWLIAMGPIGWVIAAVAGLAILIWANWDKIKKWTAKAWAWVVEKVVGGWKKIVSGTKQLGSAVLDFVKSLPGKLVSFFLNWTLPGLFIKHWSSMKEGAVNKATELLGWVKDLPGKIVKKLGDLGSLLLDAGKDLARGLWDGLESMSSWLKDKVWDWVKSVLPTAVKKALGISSPSKVMRDLAQWVPEGLALGLDDGSKTVMAASQRMADAAVPDLSAVDPNNPGDPRRRPGDGSGPGTAIHQHFPSSATPEAAAAAAGGRVLAVLEAEGI